MPAVICYEGLVIRDHWPQVTSCPWWMKRSPRIEDQIAWFREAVAAIGQDWFLLPHFYSCDERRHLRIEHRSDGPWLVDSRTGLEESLAAPVIGGDHIRCDMSSGQRGPQSEAEVDAAIPLQPHWNPATVRTDGRGELAARLLEEIGRERFPFVQVASPLTICLKNLWGFDEAMIRVAEGSELLAYACRRQTRRAVQQVREAAELGAEAIWIEEYWTDMIAPDAFARLSLPAVAEVVQAIRAAGMKSIYYFCGDPEGKWNLLLEAGADALALEESKKAFHIDIEEVANRLRGRCVLLGNLDSVGVLQDGSEAELRAELSRQVAAGRRNGGRFIMSLGSPVTPATPIVRVRRYCELAREVSRVRR